MNYSLEVIDSHKNSNILFTMALFSMAILLHQSQVIFGVNISFADLFCVLIFIVFILNKQLLIPVTPVIYFLVVSIVVLLTSIFYIPSQFMYTPNPMEIVSDYAKLAAILVYFIFGYNLSRNDHMVDILKWYSFFGMLIGGIGLVFTVLNIHTDILFYGGVRYKGLMIDPNYFSILQVTSLVYITRVKSIKMKYKYAAVLITALAVLISGSKTGILTFSSYVMLRVIEYLLTYKKKAFSVVVQLFTIGLIILAIPIVFSFLQNLVSFLSTTVPSFARIEPLFTDFNGALSENGSGRNITWKVALQIIQLSPVIGVGIGTYTTIAVEMFHQSDISHNTFLQLSAEWGIPLAFTFFAYVFFIIGKASTVSDSPDFENNLIFRDIIIILLIGSMAISLNNARILWLVFGALVSSLDRNQICKKTGGKYV
ncbi:O-antigen ligase family protein [Neobacillus sp. PS2-9]|uniref:O-antigen ligase family protein n=1 Tax=Neobacillus sp. PS2-9 TaxID=3070676 RepID=UPI0027DF62C8|nr:O-antigen ligase family protein [Neobacillus sp. PS2-9]WML59306.1 O-antigen ligase family protein [Neobacillus sp. PS2-9]